MPIVKVSIIIPTLNMLSLLKNTVEGIARTCDVPFEVIVVNNGSKQETKEWLDTLAGPLLKQNKNFIKFTPIHNPYNRGISGGVNTGIIHACGKFLCICANDILVPPGYFSWAIENLTKNPEIGTISPFYTEDQRFAGVDNFYNNYGNIQKTNEWTNNWHLSVIQVFTRELWDKVGEWDEHLMNHLMDNDHGIRIYFAGFKPTAWKGMVCYHQYGSLGRAQLANQSLVAKHDSRYYLKKWGIFPDKDMNDIEDRFKQRAIKGKYLSNTQLNFKNKIRRIQLKQEGEILQ